jgi:predicted transcriptional regulator
VAYGSSDQTDKGRTPVADTADKLALISDVASNYLRRNSIGLDQIAAVVNSVTQAMQNAERTLAGGSAAEAPVAPETESAREPAVSPRSSVKPDYIVCLDCGAKVKTLKRHLQSAHGLDPRAYRERWDLKRDYPMTAPSYSERRSAMARQLGLGRKAGESPKRRGRKKATAEAA